MERARGQLARLAVAVAVVATVFRPLVALQHFGLRDPQVNAELAILVLLGLCLDVSMFLVAKNPRFSHESALNFGLVYQVLRSFSVGLNMVRIDGLAGLPPTALTFAFGGLLLFPLIIPMRRRKALVVSLLAAATQPFALAAFSPIPVPAPVLVHCLVASAATVAFAVLCGRLGYSLTARAARGRELGAYHLEKCLLRDETGELWRARHRHLARPAAVRTLRPWLMDAAACDRAIQRFHEEARIAANLTSPHTLTLYDFGVSEDGCIYSAFQLVQGESLRRRVVRDGPLSAEAVIRLAFEACDSVQEAHAMGLLHRALTPDHVSLCHVGRRFDFTKVSGFGRARFDDVGDVGAGGPVPRESRAFPSPEVARGLPATKRSDIYQLGGLLYFALCGRLPPREGAAATLLRRAGPDPARRALLELIARCLEVDPSARFASMAELRAELERIAGVEAFEHPFAPISAALGDFAPLPGPISREPNAPDAALQLLTMPSKPRGGARDEPSSGERGRESLSPDALAAARRRLGQFGVLSAALSSLSLPIVFAGETYVRSYLPAVIASVVLGVLLDLTLVWCARSERLSTPLVFRAGLAYFLLRCALFTYAGVQTYLMLGLPAPRVTYASVFMMLLPALIPGRARTLFVPCLVIVLAYSAILVGLQPEGVDVLPVIATYSALALVSAMFTAGIMSGLRAAAAEAPSYGGYRLGTRLGRGAMGQVWSAEHELLARPAAVKLIESTHLSPDEVRAARRRFKHEAYVTARLTSPHTITLYDYGIEQDGTYYYVMELLDGEDLEHRVGRHGPVPPEQAIRVALQVCDSLAEAHARGLVHRDLKPANLFLARAGCRDDFVKVLDFGIADLVLHLTTHGDDSTGKGRMAGTPQYMAPEVFLDGEVDARSDLYQLGCVLFFLLTGHVPFEQTTFESLAYAKVHQPPPSVASMSPYAIPEGLERVVERCLERDPADRYSSAEELEADLQRLLQRRGAAYGEELSAASTLH